MKNSKLFQYVVIGAFIFFIIVGAILFSVYKSSTSSVGNINITMWGTLSSDSFMAFYSNYFADNELKYNISYVERDQATFDRDLVEALASGDGPDAIILSSDQIVRYNNKIYTIPYAVLPELTFKQTYIQESELFLNSVGALALPFMVDPLVMYWNKDIFNNASVAKPPASWTEIASLVPKMTVKDRSQNIFKSTVAMGEFRNVVNAKDIFSALLIQTGNPIVNLGSDGLFKSTLNESFGQNTSPATLALEFFTNFSNSSKPGYSWNRSLPSSLESFTNGDLAMYFGFASEYLTIKNKNPNLNFEVALLPQIAKAQVRNTFGKMYSFAIMKKSANPAGVYTVISALSSAQAVPFWKDIFNLPSARVDSVGNVSNSAVKTIFNQSAIISKGWYDPNKAGTNTIFQEMVESYTTGRDSIETTIGTASDRLDNLLK